jgi:transcriptional regulator with XRE-family HTH domain
MNTMAERLRAAREQAGLSQGHVAAKLKMQRPTITEIEAGRRKVTAEEAGSFAELYDVSVAWLIQGKETDVDPSVELAARVLSKLKREDINSLLQLLRTRK